MTPTMMATMTRMPTREILVARIMVAPYPWMMFMIATGQSGEGG
jgi:hypothetical protein